MSSKQLIRQLRRAQHALAHSAARASTRIDELDEQEQRALARWRRKVTMPKVRHHAAA